MNKNYLLFTFDSDELRQLIREELAPFFEPAQTTKLLNDDELLSIDEACAFLKISRPTLRKLTRMKKINSKMFGRTIRYNKSNLINSFKNNHDENR